MGRPLIHKLFDKVSYFRECCQEIVILFGFVIIGIFVLSIFGVIVFYDYMTSVDCDFPNDKEE